jgi:uracil-DNA glycosylase family 4
MNLDKLINSFEKTENFYREELSDEKILFIHDSCVMQRGQVYEFSDNEYSMLKSLLDKSDIPDNSYQFAAAIKEVGLTEDEATTADLHANRPLIEEDIKTIDPDLIFVLGNLAMKTVLKKSGLGNKRGKEYHLEIDGKDYPVVPVYHPFSLYSEPSTRGLFVQDINNAYGKFILNNNKLANSSYELCKTVKQAVDCITEALKRDVIAVDLETTGLDYKKDKITTFGVATDEGEAFVIPFYHRESPFTEDELDDIKKYVRLLMAGNVNKVFHNCKFDLKFLRNWGVDMFANIDDTQMMHSLVDENMPHGLMDLVKEYFPKELEKF